MGAWPLVNLYRFPAFNAFPDSVGTMSRWIPAWAGRNGKYLRIADPIFPIRAAAISFALVLIRAMNSRIIVMIQSMFSDILSRLVDLRNSRYFGNFIGNGARKTVYLSDTKRARHGRDQIPVLRGDLIQKSGWRGRVPHESSKN